MHTRAASGHPVALERSTTRWWQRPLWNSLCSWLDSKECLDNQFVPHDRPNSSSATQILTTLPQIAQPLSHWWRGCPTATPNYWGTTKAPVISPDSLFMCHFITKDKPELFVSFVLPQCMPLERCDVMCQHMIPSGCYVLKWEKVNLQKTTVYSAVLGEILICCVKTNS